MKTQHKRILGIFLLIAISAALGLAALSGGEIGMFATVLLGMGAAYGTIILLVWCFT